MQHPRRRPHQARGPGSPRRERHRKRAGHLDVERPSRPRAGGAGHLIGRGVGPSQLSATVGALSKTITARVSAGQVDTIELDCGADPTVPEGENGACVVKIGRPRPLRVRLLGHGQTAVGFTHRWQIDDRTVAHVVDDTVVGKKVGKTKITVSAGRSRARLAVEVWPSACSETVQAVLTYMIPGRQAQRRRTRRAAQRATGGKKVSLVCRVADPESCIQFHRERRGLSYPESFEQCCCAANIR